MITSNVNIWKLKHEVQFYLFHAALKQVMHNVLKNKITKKIWKFHYHVLNHENIQFFTRYMWPYQEKHEHFIYMCPIIEIYRAVCMPDTMCRWPYFKSMNSSSPSLCLIMKYIGLYVPIPDIGNHITKEWTFHLHAVNHKNGHTVHTCRKFKIGLSSAIEGKRFE